MNVEQVDVIRLKLFQASFEGDSQALRMLALIVRPDTHVARGEIGGVLGGDNYLISILTSGHPFTYPCLALLGLIVVSCVDEIATVFVEVVQHFEAGFLVTFAQEVLPGIAKVHGTETKRGDSDTCYRSEDPVITKQTLGLWGWLQHD